MGVTCTASRSEPSVEMNELTQETRYVWSFHTHTTHTLYIRIPVWHHGTYDVRWSTFSREVFSEAEGLGEIKDVKGIDSQILY